MQGVKHDAAHACKLMSGHEHERQACAMKVGLCSPPDQNANAGAPCQEKQAVPPQQHTNTRRTNGRACGGGPDAVKHLSTRSRMLIGSGIIHMRSLLLAEPPCAGKRGTSPGPPSDEWPGACICSQSPFGCWLEWPGQALVHRSPAVQLAEQANLLCLFAANCMMSKIRLLARLFFISASSTGVGCIWEGSSTTPTPSMFSSSRSSLAVKLACTEIQSAVEGLLAWMGCGPPLLPIPANTVYSCSRLDGSATS